MAACQQIKYHLSACGAEAQHRLLGIHANRFLGVSSRSIGRLERRPLAPHAKAKSGKQSSKGARKTKAAKPRSVPASAAVEPEIIDVEGQYIDMRIPVTVITGFLGSGKTTLLNNILTKSHGKRIAVIENEFGEIDIDSELVASKDTLPDSGDQIMMLNNGCMCCTVKEDLVLMLNDLIDRRDQFDQIVIETTGLANPAPIINTLMAHNDMQENIRLDGVVTLVDAKHVEQHLDDKEMSEEAVNEAVEQIAYADRILLNKVDLVSPADISRLERRIRSINGMAQIQQVQRADVSVDYVLGIGGFDLERVDAEVHADQHQQTHSHAEPHSHEEHSHSHHTEHSETHTHSQHSSSPSSHSDSHTVHSESHSHSHDHHDHDHDHHDHVHDDSVSSVSLMLEGSMDLNRVNMFLGGLLELDAENMYRYKGLLAVADADERFVFQGVHMLFECMPDRQWRADEKRYCKMVFIGRDLDKEMIREGFKECLVE